MYFCHNKSSKRVSNISFYLHLYSLNVTHHHFTVKGEVATFKMLMRRKSLNCVNSVFVTQNRHISRWQWADDMKYVRNMFFKMHGAPHTTTSIKVCFKPETRISISASHRRSRDPKRIPCFSSDTTVTGK